MNKRIPAIFTMLVLAVFFAQSTFGQTSKGIELYNSGHFQEAEKVLRDVLKGNPSDLSANYYLGLSVLLQKRQNEALALFLKVKMNRDKMGQKVRPAVSEYQIQLALARTNIEMKHFDEALRNLDAAGKEDPKAADVFVYRGVYYLDQEKHKEALKELDKAISLDAKNAYAYYYRGMAYFHSGQGAEAGADLKKFLELAPNAPDAGEAKRLVTILC
jgi:tetratricopeptide (TPR) repeat protein